MNYYQTDEQTNAELAADFWKTEIFRDQRRQYTRGEKVVVRDGTQLADGEVEPTPKHLRPFLEQGCIGTVVSIRSSYGIPEYLVDFSMGKRTVWAFSDELKQALPYADLVTENQRLRQLLTALLLKDAK